MGKGTSSAQQAPEQGVSPEVVVPENALMATQQLPGGGNAQSHPHPVAQKPKNAWGLHDVHGNVWEWCADAWDENAHALRTRGLTVDPRRLTFAVSKAVPMSAESADRGASRVVRGGSWYDWHESARSANRGTFVPSDGDRNFGFRLLLCPPERP